jgi:hypothetical protein
MKKASASVIKPTYEEIMPVYKELFNRETISVHVSKGVSSRFIDL